MTEHSENLAELHDLLEEVFEDCIDEARAARLEELLKNSPQARQEYLSAIRLHGRLLWDLGGQPQCHTVSDSSELSPDVPQIPRIEAKASIVSSNSSTAATPYLSIPSLLGDLANGSVGYFSSGWPVAYLVATVVFGVGLLIGWLVPQSTPVQIAAPSPTVKHGSPASEPPVQFVGRITGMVDCQWADPNTAVPGPVAVPLGRKYALSSGLMEITYNTGARVILQGPCTYEVESPTGGFLSIGKLTARVEKNEEERTRTEQLSASRSSFLIPHSYFAVRTPTATVTDLGTEFGVEVSKEGATTSHVFRGSVELRTIPGNDTTQSIARVLHENEWASVKKTSDSPDDGPQITVAPPTATTVAFVRDIPKQTIKTVDLVDVVAGGDGFSGRRNAGIDPTNGRVVDTQRIPSKVEDYFVGDGKYHRVETLPFVDGVFIPNGRGGPMQIDSAGHVFDGFGVTSDFAPSHIWSLGEKPAEEPRTELGGVEYGSPGHGALHLPANNGITFDLDAIRRANPGYKLLRFRAVTGNTETAPESFGPVFADIWVLVDGQVRFRRREINRYNGEFSVVIAIGDNDRFLTLAATDGGNGIYWDSILFGDPRLEMTPTAVGQETSKRPE